MIYTFEFVGVNGRIGHLDLGVFIDDCEAERAARVALSDHKTAVRIDVWSEDIRILTIDRPTEPETSDAERPLRASAA